MKNYYSFSIAILSAAFAVLVSAATFAADQPATSPPAASTTPLAIPAIPAPPAVPLTALSSASAPAATSPTTPEEKPTTSLPQGENVVNNPYGLEALWKEGDFIARGTIFVLSIMSMGSWYILITKIIDQFKLGGQARAAKKSFWKAQSIQEGIATLKEGSPFRYMAEMAVKSTQHHEGLLLEKINLNDWVSMSIQRAVERISSSLQSGLSFLATVGSTAPFVGLFGTVWGIYGALTRIGIAGQASIDKVAGPVGEALIMTAFGLFVAVPAVLGYNYLVRRNKTAMEDVRTFSADLHLVTISGVMSSSQAANVHPTDKK